MMMKVNSVVLKYIAMEINSSLLKLCPLQKLFKYFKTMYLKLLKAGSKSIEKNE